MIATLNIDYAAEAPARLPVRPWGTGSLPAGPIPVRDERTPTDEIVRWRPVRAFRPRRARRRRRAGSPPAGTGDGEAPRLLAAWPAAEGLTDGPATGLWREVWVMDAPGGWAHSIGIMDPADARDIGATLDGDRQAFGRIVERYQQSVAARMWRFTRDRRQLEELVEEVFVEAWYSLSGFRGDAPLLHWLQRIATRTGYRFWKRRDRRAEHELPLQDWNRPAGDPPEAALEATEAAEKLHRLMAELPPRDRLVLTLMYVEELSVAQTAEQTGWSQTMVKVQAHRARNKLRVLLEKSGGSDR